MDKDYSHMAGKHIVIDGVNYFSNEYFGDGLSNGYVYKNEQAFCENPDEVCYIPEAAFSDATPVTIDGVDYYKVDDTVYRTTLVEGKPYLEVLGQMYGKLAQKYNYDSNGVKYSNLY